ncbi:MAG: secondary thiamine-phosphate synthase enzyme YjbQ [Bacteriovoracaceae bacterium]|jgi:secondary thiamine-phosphate synthase enzyme|nr:secondary thiamine-phosphate synthase enzyme YjbQ [Bacteriovoracaceae bacterium]
MSIQQIQITLPKMNRGYHLIDSYISEALPPLPLTGLLNLFLKHTSCALTLNENCDPSVRNDMETAINRMAPEDNNLYTHTQEGEDDMPAHIKTSLLGNSLTIPISDKKLNLGTWQGIYLCEFRNHPSTRKLVLTVYQ